MPYQKNKWEREPNAADQAREEKEQERFRKEHPGLFEEADGFVLNGQAVDPPEIKRKRRAAKRYRALHWTKTKGVLLAVFLVLFFSVIPFPIHIHRTLPMMSSQNGNIHADTLEVKGIHWKSLLNSANTFRGTLKSSTFEVKIKSSITANSYNEEGYHFMIFKKIDILSDTAYEFGRIWEHGQRIRIKNGFKTIVAGAGRNIAAAPAQTQEELEEWKQESDFQ